MVRDHGISGIMPLRCPLSGINSLISDNGHLDWYYPLRIGAGKKWLWASRFLTKMPLTLNPAACESLHISTSEPLLKNLLASSHSEQLTPTTHTLWQSYIFHPSYLPLWIFHALLVTKLPVPERRLSSVRGASGCSWVALTAFAIDWMLPWPSHEPRCTVKGETEQTDTSSAQRSFTKWRLAHRARF